MNKFTKLMCVLLLIGGMASSGVAQVGSERTVTGTVTDVMGEPIPGATVVVKGTTTGSVTDLDGAYSLTVPGGDGVLVFSFVGMSSVEVPIGNQNQIDVTLLEDAANLDEVVVVGYGTQRKATLTGSIAGIGSEELMRSPSTTVGSAIQGLVPGLASMQRTGTPGADLSNILIRGQSTTGNNSPLVLVDGVPEPDWQRISPNDIESISVLKDASAAIYGVQAANGVILITTKRGAVGKPTFNITYNQGIVQPTRIPKMASSATLAEYANEFLMRTGGDPMWTDEEIQKFRDGSDPAFYPNTDWPDEILRDFSFQNSTNLNVRGGTENVKYSLSGSYQHQGDLIEDGLHEFDNYTIRSNIDALVSKSLILSLDLNAGLGDRMAPRYGGSFGYYIAPFFPVYLPGGYPGSLPSDQGQHPMINNTGGSGYDNDIEKRFSAKFSYDLDIPFVEGLGLDGYFFYSDQNNHRKIWSTPWTYYAWDEEAGEPVPLQGGFAALANLEERYSNSFSNLFHFKVKYERQFGYHYLNTFLAAESSKGHYKEFSGFRRDYMAQAIDELFAGSDVNQRADGLSSENARRNFLGRLSYNYKEKYLVDFNYRYDGSYRFPKGKRWGFFPGVSVAYRISEEDFMGDNSFFDDLKIRASYGKMGNDAIAPFQYLQSYNLRTSGVYFGDPVIPHPVIWGGVAPNPDVTWEVATMNNIGLDALIFNQSLGITLDAFQQRRSNILTTRSLEIPAYTGLILPAENIGVVDNRGLELALNYQNSLSIGSGLSYSIKGNIGYARNKVVDVSEAADVPEHQKMEGRILGAGLYYKAIGIFRTQEEVDTNPIVPGTIVGDLQYLDYDNDGVITANDRIRMDKSINPEITYGLNLSGAYKGLSLYAHFAGVARAHWWIFDIARTTHNAPAELLENRYTPGSMDSKYPWLPTWHPDYEVSGMTSDFWVKNAAFFRLKTLELSYNLPQNLISRLSMDRLRVYVSGSNLFTISEIKNYDPEGANLGTNYGSAAFYPQTKVYNIGVQVTF